MYYHNCIYITMVFGIRLARLQIHGGLRVKFPQVWTFRTNYVFHPCNWFQPRPTVHYFALCSSQLTTTSLSPSLLRCLSRLSYPRSVRPHDITRKNSILACASVLTDRINASGAHVQSQVRLSHRPPHSLSRSIMTSAQNDIPSTSAIDHESYIIKGDGHLYPFYRLAYLP
ncbi:hypothetical protein GALMADRAFT_483957 [Galerina marginata CBS 339.88]|uniref:Uncharacterized protein n=1 Tax=Galerina marginata (strain CBS 339.88) TaxID=685588 RepID=A0A067SX91_GALM3|nr:hypothetical protein GALMADRAFT_483957 [Galerina marginata CBS 339.88]